jgi:formylglycine-generating enzyme required for sulfatase activity
MEQVSWNDAVAFCARLSELPEEKEAGRVYRLPSEAEWEYACRAGTTTPFSFGTSASSTQANFIGRYPYNGAEQGPDRQSTTRAGEFPPNAWGLFDMHGNLWEWCSDAYSPTVYARSPRKDPKGPRARGGQRRVLRGGCWAAHGVYCRSAARNKYDSTFRWSAYGFRVACTVPPTR